MRPHSVRATLHRVIFEHDTAAGKVFDVVLIVAILSSVLVVMLDSVASVRAEHGLLLRRAEWFFTLLFSVEYLLRLWSARSARAYALSFYGAIDLLSILPTYLATLFPGGRFLAAVRVLRVLRVFRILKLSEYIQQGAVLSRALRASRYKITVFLIAVLSTVVVVGSLMYLIEGPSSGFTSIPQAVYWAIVTLTTVGYGDVAPQTAVGKALAATLMILGYGIIAVPTGIVTLELDRASRTPAAAAPCPRCGLADHDGDALHCKRCGSRLAGARPPPPDAPLGAG